MRRAGRRCGRAGRAGRKGVATPGRCAAIAVLSGALALGGRPLGSPHWRHPAEGRGTPAVDASRVYFLTAHHEVIALSRGSGEVMWRQTTGEPGADTLGSLVLLSGSVVVAGDRGVHGLDALTGARLWRFSRADDGGAGAYLGDVADGVVWVGSRAGRVYGIDAKTGELRRSAIVSGAPETTVFQPIVDADIVVAGYTTFATPQTGGVIALDRAAGGVRWAHALGGEGGPSGFAGGPVVAGGVVLVSGGDGRIRALSRETGDLVWELPAVTRPDGRRQERDWRALALRGTLLVAGSLSGVVSAFDLTTRREWWRFVLPEGGSVALRLTADGDTVYVPHLGGRLAALSAADGRVRWQMGGLSDGFSWAPALAGDVAYAAARAGLFALPR
ncbi:MAG: PQQ-binding-like beta-propeller repeat protein [Vicinamibacterales bacterium]